MKIGIVTHFYKNTNYGGLLQSYALTKKLEMMGYNAEQLCYVMSIKDISKQPFSLKCFIKKVYVTLKRMAKRVLQGNKSTPVVINPRSEAFDLWSKAYIRQSRCIYTTKNIKKSVNEYDVFITGSDQVWNYSWYDKNFFLSFVPKEKKKIAYAASLGHSQMHIRQCRVFKKHLKTFNAVSVREKDSVPLIQDLSPVGASWVLDPVFLLEKEEWLNIITSRQIQDKYIFCYFLHNAPKQMALAYKYAKKKGFKIVFVAGMFQESGELFGDIRLENVDPSEFLSQIHYAEMVFTDSFHASAFSCIFNKRFCVFGRGDATGMDVRIESLMALFDCEECFCNLADRQNLDYIESVAVSTRTKNLKELGKRLAFSEEFLKNNLEGR